MARTASIARRRVAATALSAAACLALLAGAALPAGAAAAGIAPLTDGWRAAPAPVVTVTMSVLRFDRGGRLHRTVTRSAVMARALAVTPASPDPCVDKAKSFTGGAWTGTMSWAFRASSTPEDLSRTATAKALKRSVANITGAHNDCGRVDRVSATAAYLGATGRALDFKDLGSCKPTGDRVNVVGFGRVPNGDAALTCIWSIGDQIIEADMKLDRSAGWATSLASCHSASLLEAVATHEFGHVFGLGHVPEATHGRLTMSERLDGLCEDNEASLGLGDMLGLEKLY